MRRKRRGYERSEIARYWCQDAPLETRRARGTADLDWGEPTCFACRCFIPEWWWETVAKLRPRDVFGTWRAATWLEKAHVVPLYVGGEDELHNIVLLCGLCHGAQPDERDVETAWLYITQGGLSGKLLRTALQAHQAVGRMTT